MGVLIIGAGNGGLAFGAKLIERGIKVNLYDKFDSAINPIQENNNEITMISNGRTKKLRFNFVSNNLKETLIDMNFIFVVVPAFAHHSIAIELSETIIENQIVVLHPGRTGGALEFKNIFTSKRKENIIAEAETMLFAARKDNPTEIKIHGVKKSVGLASIPTSMSQKITDQVNNYLPYFHNSESVITTSLSNIGAIFHPVPFLFNLTRIECKENFKYYHEGITPSISKLLESLDKERLTIAQGFGLDIQSAKEWVNFNYEVNGKTLYEAIQLNNSYKDISAPTDIHSRYVMEDIPMSLVPMRELAKLANIKTPLIDSIVNTASKLYNYDFICNGRRIEHMKLNSLHTTPTK
ncbi:NAD/NADP octopine/nopaline dehydrogenase family protein [Oceanobacillus oncorhynchi]|uniref:NAD/NADP octopine/nopaline dehydrogenase family protein n=1 Tax=Oceanobacillus oncorhynchi TaxID=545501 RepID=UPI0021167BDF|nr:NAD/NADP-dependent octopine/nopaline dehydrogenase family protein [Oceanobacillus oncorhynchi]MDM8101234.1 NAD/NADP octopine/nopaline dehydrogenase family protein [Oceanobacillus oncorhynchi]UUI39504.1 NAD/NADP octopine/nopaline dehydrogenase family protein [Oceanobacillus oncorhynchi]